MAKQNVAMKNLVLKSNPNASNTVKIDGREIELNSHGTTIKDDGLAKELEARHSAGRKGELTKDVVVAKVPMYTENLHNYFFGSMPEMPWKKKKEQEDGNN